MAVLNNFTPAVTTSATVCQTASFKYDLFYGFLSFVEDFRGNDPHYSALHHVERSHAGSPPFLLKMSKMNFLETAV